MLDLSRDLEEEAARFVRSLCRHRSPDEKQKANAVLRDAYGDVATVRGGMFNANGGRDVRLSLAGLTRADVTAFRKSLKKRLGFEPPVPMAEALLIQTHNSPEAIVSQDQEKRRKRERDKKAKRRQWAREHGYCIICCKNAAGFDADGNQLATCKDCREKVVANRKKG